MKNATIVEIHAIIEIDNAAKSEIRVSVTIQVDMIRTSIRFWTFCFINLRVCCVVLFSRTPQSYSDFRLYGRRKNCYSTRPSWRIIFKSKRIRLPGIGSFDSEIILLLIKSSFSCIQPRYETVPSEPNVCDGFFQMSTDIGYTSGRYFAYIRERVPSGPTYPG